MTKCEKQYQKAIFKKRVLLTFVIVICLVGAYFSYMFLKPPDKFISPHFDVERDDLTGEITLQPKEPNTHECTIIYLHEYGNTNEQMFEIFANKNGTQQFAPK